MKNEPKPISRPKKKTKSALKKTPPVQTTLLSKKKKPAKKIVKNKIGTLDNANLHKLERELRETKERLHLLTEATEEGIAIHDKGIILDANDALARIFGYELSEIIGMKAERLATPESWKVIRKHIATEYDKPYEGVGVRKDGSTFICSLVGKPYKYKGRTLRLSTFHDITERKKSEEALEKYREHLEDLVRERTIKLEASNKELEAFSYSASHDLRAPLRTIDGFSQALLEDCEDKLDIQGKDYLIRIKAATRRMADLIEDLLQLSRVARTEMNIEKINLTRIAQSIIDELQKSQPQRHVEIKIADGLEDTADSRLMRITLDNLLGNAWKFTEKQAKAVIEFGCTKEGKKKVYFIRDNGAGFDMAYADKLFAPFQRLHNEEEFPGTGIGLALVRRIIHRHGGKVWAEGQTGKGATFYFNLNEK